MTTRYYEDITPGETFDLGGFSLAREEMMAFAEQYDPQPIHIDPEAAEASMYGGLIASGWHTGARCMRQLADEFLADVESMGSFGLEHLTWSNPVRPGDRIAVSLEIIEKRTSESYPERGYITTELRGTNADGDEVISWRATNIFARRDV